MSAFGRIFCPFFRSAGCFYRLWVVWGTFYGLIGLALGSAVIGTFCMRFFLFFRDVVASVFRDIFIRSKAYGIVAYIFFSMDKKPVFFVGFAVLLHTDIYP